jgi:hypothetical protein
VVPKPIASPAPWQGPRRIRLAVRRSGGELSNFAHHNIRAALFGFGWVGLPSSAGDAANNTEELFTYPKCAADGCSFPLSGH